MSVSSSDNVLSLHNCVCNSLAFFWSHGGICICALHANFCVCLMINYCMPDVYWSCQWETDCCLTTHTEKTTVDLSLYSLPSLEHTHSLSQVFQLAVIHLITTGLSLAFGPFSTLPTLQILLITTQTCCQTKAMFSHQMVLASSIKTWKRSKCHMNHYYRFYMRPQ